MSRYTIDILEADKDLNKALDQLGENLAELYRDCWDETKKTTYDNKPFDLHIEAFARLWLNKVMKIFMAYDDKRKPVGFLIGMVFRPLPYNASVFQIEDWFTRGDKDMEHALFNHVGMALKHIGCDEVWINDGGPKDPPLGSLWVERRSFNIRRYTRS